MPATLYAVHGSHPCAAVLRALELKGIEHRVVEFPPPFHMPVQRLRTGARTVPSMRFEDGDVVSGSSAILHRLDAMVPDPPLFGDPRVAEAERWGEATLQPLGRTLLWRSFARSPRSMVAYQEGSRLPALPAPLVLALAPVVTRIERRANRADDTRVRADLAALPGHLDRVDAWIAEGVLGGDPPSAADLQIGSTLRLLLTLGDLRPLIDPRPAGRLARTLWPEHPGDVPAGTLPAQWLPAAA